MFKETPGQERNIVENVIQKISYFIISFFAMFITLLSFVLLSLQILFVSIIWMIISFLNHVNYKRSHYGVER